MSSGNAPKIVFISVPGDKNALSQRERELQAAEARAHAARVSRRPTKPSTVKTEPGSKSGASSSSATPGASATSNVRFPRIRRPRVRKEVEENTKLMKRRLYSVPPSSLGQGQVDPFDSAPVKGLDNFIYSILDFAYDYAFPSFVPDAPVHALPTHRANRRKLGRQYGFLLEAQIVAAAKFQMSPLISLTDENQRRMQAIVQVHEQRAQDQLNLELQTTMHAPSDTLVYACALLAYVSGPNYSLTATKHPKSPLATAQNLHAMGHLHVVPQRVQTVRSLVKARGGIDELSMPFQRIVLTYLDTIVSTRMGVRPGWSWPTAIPESLQRTGEHIPDHAASQMMEVMGSGFGELEHAAMRQALLLMCEATVALDHCHRGGSSAPAIWGVARMRVAVQHRLCSFDPLVLDGLDFAGLRFELCRLSALTYSDLVLFPIPDETSIKPTLLYELGRTLDKFETEREDSKGTRPGSDDDLIAWSTLLAGAASTLNTTFRGQYIKRLRRLIHKNEKLQNWDYYIRLVKRYLWWSYLLDPLAYEAFNEASWQGIGSGSPSELERREETRGMQHFEPWMSSWGSTVLPTSSTRTLPNPATSTSTSTEQR